jgi:hypothetical protein
LYLTQSMSFIRYRTAAMPINPIHNSFNIDKN